MDYWEICIRECFDESSIVATEDQIKNVIAWVEGAHDNYGLATGLDVANANHISDEEIELNELKKQIRLKEDWVSSTSPCKPCNTTGIVADAWGRDATCQWCNGEGRNKSRY